MKGRNYIKSSICFLDIKVPNIFSEWNYLRSWCKEAIVSPTGSAFDPGPVASLWNSSVKLLKVMGRACIICKGN